MTKFRMVVLRDKLLDVIPLLREYFGDKPLIVQIKLISVLEAIADRIRKRTDDKRHPDGD